MLIKTGLVFISVILAVLCPQTLAQTTAQDWIDQGVSLYSQGKYNESIQSFEKAINLDPKNADAWYNKGVVLYNQRKFYDSLEAFNRAIEANPLDADSWYNKGSALTALGRTASADDAFAKARELGSNDQNETASTKSTPDEDEAGTSEDWLNKGNKLYNQGKYEEAIKAYDNAIELDPGNPKVWQNKGYALNKLGLNQEANECFWKATGLNAGYASDRKQWAIDSKSKEWRLKGTTNSYSLMRARSKISNDDAVSLNPYA